MAQRFAQWTTLGRISVDDAAVVRSAEDAARTRVAERTLVGLLLARVTRGPSVFGSPHRRESRGPVECPSIAWRSRLPGDGGV